jgi:uncharacterized protein (DUF697 family)
MEGCEPPLVWLLGKTGAGKSSIVAALTGAPGAAVGEGFAPTTAQAQLFDFPVDDPALRFLDTRGLEDTAAHDPGEMLALGQTAADVLVIAVRADDLSLGAVLAAAKAARAQRPGLPVIVAQTRLHDLYPGDAGHAEPYPFDGTAADAARTGVPAALGAALLAQRRLFAALPGTAPLFVPLDFTRPGDGFEPADYGAEALWQALRAAAPTVAGALVALPDLRRSVILPWAGAAAAAEAVPLPVLGGLGAAGLQAAMVRAIARRHGLAGGVGLWAEFAGLLGARFALGYGGRFLVRQVLKLAPGWGSAAVAAWSFAVTWGLGEAAAVYCAARAEGRAPDRAAVTAAYAEGLDRARAAWARRGSRDDAA